MTLRVFLLSLIVSFATVQISFAQSSYANNQCSALFNPIPLKLKPPARFDDHYKLLILKEALSHTKIKLTQDEKHLDDVLAKWDLRDSTPQKIERLAQALVMKSDSKKSFSMWLRDLIIKDQHVKEVTRVKYETDILTVELLDALDMRGYHYKNSKFDNYKAFRQKHYNKIQLAKFVAINGLIMGAISHLTNSNFLVPLYFPSVDLVRSFDATLKELYLVRAQGFDKAYPTILNNHKLALRGEAALVNAPKALFSAALAYVAYNYFMFKAEQNIEEVRYTISENQKIPVHEKYFLEWKVDFEKREGRAVDMKTAQDRHEWDLFVQSMYRAWADMYNAKNGRYPELTKEQDLLEWEQFLASVE